MKAEDVMKMLSWIDVASNNMGSATLSRDEVQGILALIREKDAEIERYRKIVGDLVIRDGEVVGIIDGKETRYIDKSVSNVLKTMAVNRAKADTVRKMQERLKKKMNDLSRIEYGGVPYSLVSKSFIDQIAKEMLEDE